MKRMMKRLLSLILVLALCLLSGTAWAVDTGESNLVEPMLDADENAPFEQYQDITVGDSLTAEITTEGTYAYFRFVPEISHSYVFTSASSGDTYGFLYDENGVEITSDDDGGSELNFKGTYTLEAGNTYYWVVRWCFAGVTGTIPVSLSYGETEHTYGADGFCVC